jgi:hypothetical protein
MQAGGNAEEAERRGVQRCKVLKWDSGITKLCSLLNESKSTTREINSDQNEDPCSKSQRANLSGFDFRGVTLMLYVLYILFCNAS